MTNKVQGVFFVAPVSLSICFLQHDIIYESFFFFLDGDKYFCCDRVDLLYAHVDSLVLSMLDL